MVLDELIGGWETCKNRGWCYVEFKENSTCKDQIWQNVGDDFSPNRNKDNAKTYIWLTDQSVEWEVAISRDACKGKKHNTGNEEFLDGVKITKNELTNTMNKTINIDLSGHEDLGEDLYKKCQDACSSRNENYMECSAWSFNKKAQSATFIVFMLVVDKKINKRKMNHTFLDTFVLPAGALAKIVLVI